MRSDDFDLCIGGASVVWLAREAVENGWLVRLAPPYAYITVNGEMMARIVVGHPVVVNGEIAYSLSS